MSLPRAVQQQVEEADALVAQMNGTQPVNPDTGEPIVPASQPAPDPQPQPISQEPDPKPAVPDETWEQRYHSLKGKFDAEVPRLYAQVREMNDQIKTLIAENAVAKVQPAQPDPVSTKTLITEQDKEAFGSDLLDLIDRATEQKLTGSRHLEAQLRAEIDELKGKLGTVSERQVVSDTDRYESALNNAVPDWQALNVDQGFLNWLAEVDPVYGMPRQYALNNAYEAKDALRTATIFNQYKKTLAPATPQSNGNKELQRQVAPTRSRTSPAPTNPNMDKRVYSQQDIDAFYTEWRRGFIDEAEAVQIEKDIHAATVEGRIRY
jgi:hypothetical protein